MFTEHIRECQQYTDYYLCKKHKCDLKYCMETYSLVVVVFLNCTTLTEMDSCLFKALLHLLQQRCLKDIKDTYSSKKKQSNKKPHYQNDKPNGKQRADQWWLDVLTAALWGTGGLSSHRCPPEPLYSHALSCRRRKENSLFLLSASVHFSTGYKWGLIRLFFG